MLCSYDSRLRFVAVLWTDAHIPTTCYVIVILTTLFKYDSFDVGPWNTRVSVYTNAVLQVYTSYVQSVTILLRWMVDSTTINIRYTDTDKYIYNNGYPFYNYECMGCIYIWLYESWRVSLFVTDCKPNLLSSNRSEIKFIINFEFKIYFYIFRDLRSIANKLQYCNQAKGEGKRGKVTER